VNRPWATWLSLLLTSSCIQPRGFEDSGGSGAGSGNSNAGQAGASSAPSGAGFGADPQAGSAADAGDCFPGVDGKVPDGCVVGASLAAGDDFNCGLLAAGGVYCWGNDSDGQRTDAPESGNFISIAAGSRHACVLRVDHTLHCWGNNSQLQAPMEPPATYGRFQSIACGDDYTCGVHLDGTPLCFGNPADGKLDAPNDKYLMIATGSVAACGLRSSNRRVVCWGDDTWGIVSSAPGGVFVTVAVGPEHACAIASDRQMVCWGNGSPGGGDGSGATRTDVRPGSYLAVSAGAVHTAALTVGDHFACFGDASAARQCGSLSSAENFGGWYQVAAGRGHTCILGDPEGNEAIGTVECFGLDRGSAIPFGKVFKSGR